MMAALILFVIVFSAIVFFCKKMHAMTGNQFAGQGFIFAFSAFTATGVGLFCLCAGIVVLCTLFPLFIPIAVCLVAYKLVKGFLGGSNVNAVIAPGAGSSKENQKVVRPISVTSVRTFKSQVPEIRLVVHFMSDGNYNATVNNGQCIGTAIAKTMPEAARRSMGNAPFKLTTAQITELMLNLK
jgi:hypothetical protein